MNDVLGEFLGTAILTLMGCGVVAGVVLGKSKAQNAGWISITAGWAFAVVTGILTARAAGGPGYINPVGPLADFVTGKLRIDVAIAYAAAEVAGAFTGAVLVWAHYWPHWAATPDAGAKLAVFGTSPAIRNLPANVTSEAIATFALVFVGTAVAANDIPGPFAIPFAGALVWGIGLSLGATTGYAINPARDLGPRLAHWLLPIPGKGGSDWGYAWVPLVGPCVGAVAAVLLAKAVMPS